MNREANVNLLNQIYLNSIVGIEALTKIKDKIDDVELQKRANEQLNKYLDVKEEVEEEFVRYEVAPPDENHEFEKTLAWTGIDVDKLNTDQTEKLVNIIVDSSKKDIESLEQGLDHFHESDLHVQGYARDLIDFDLRLVAGLYYYYPSYFPK